MYLVHTASYFLQCESVRFDCVLSLSKCIFRLTQALLGKIFEWVAFLLVELIFKSP